VKGKNTYTGIFNSVGVAQAKEARAKNTLKWRIPRKIIGALCLQNDDG
jgi:hypothetical protein